MRLQIFTINIACLLNRARSCFVRPNVKNDFAKFTQLTSPNRTTDYIRFYILLTRHYHQPRINSLANGFGEVVKNYPTRECFISRDYSAYGKAIKTHLKSMGCNYPKRRRSTKKSIFLIKIVQMQRFSDVKIT